ncbi:MULTISPECIES: VOC family protein [unclassified Fusibacter]|uniref:VOC family protein n=1 Tax=unclassified Fusibacter TaxID=2624464 RepID=UPI0010121166|nr:MULTISPECIES: VOC family protein [unclassified Fusibacter]MCK8059401.1 VOC family protein [Fusibacter sp. A2]NPE21135.1 VOC family protein [Fusibacter sp. A1]RXV62404.1 VOC family protein [Fusibacter sp. A1]
MKFSSMMTFLYFDQFESATDFFESVLELEMVFDPGWARVYQTSGGAFLGAVDRSKGSVETEYKGGTLISLTVDDLEASFEKIKSYTPNTITEIKHFEDLGLKSFFFKGPEGYDFEIQMFLNDTLKLIF